MTCVAASGCGRSGFELAPGASADGGGDAVTVDTPPLAYEVVFTDLAATQPPSRRRSTGAAVDPATDRIYIYGGYDGTFLSDAYAYTPGTNIWTSIVSSGTPPGSRERHALAWDPVGNALVVFGGQNLPSFQLVHYDTLHVMTPSGAWSQIPKVGTWPAARKDAVLIWLSHLGTFLLYGGSDGPNAADRFGDAWLLALDAAGATATWTQLTSTALAPKRSAACVAYDPTAKRVILYGGETADGVDVNSTHIYSVDTNAWATATTTGATPVGESFSQCAWDPVSRRVVLFGGQADGGAPLTGVYTYDPQTQAWATPPVASAQPTSTSDAGAVYSDALGAMFWFGGRPGSTTYTNTSWTMDVQ